MFFMLKSRPPAIEKYSYNIGVPSHLAFLRKVLVVFSICFLLIDIESNKTSDWLINSVKSIRICVISNLHKSWAAKDR